MSETIRLRPGQTLSQIAHDHGTTVDALAQANHLADPNKAKAGQQIVIPGQSQTAPAAPRAPAPQAAPQAPASSAPQPRDQAQFGGQADAHVRTPFVYQMTLERPKEACFRACTQMARSGGAEVTSPAEAMWLNAAPFGRQTPPNAARGYIDRQLDAGRPVVVGVNHPNGSNKNADGVTDHWLVVTGRGTDAQGRTYYTFHDPGTRVGQDTNPRNRLYVDAQSGRLYRPEGQGGGIQAMRYDMTAVRTNRR